MRFTIQVTIQILRLSRLIINQSAMESCSLKTEHTTSTTFDKYFSIYPNPTSGIVNVNYFGNQSAEMTIQVIDITGKVVATYLTSAYSYTIDLSQLAAGSYTMQITGDGGVATKKLILQ
jgi:hypothetical protein